MSDETPIQISGIAIKFLPVKADTVREALQQIEGLEIHLEDPAGKMVITLEDRNSKGMTEAIGEIETVEGVIAVNPVYIHDETTLTEI